MKQSLHRGKTKIKCLVNLWQVFFTFGLVVCIQVFKTNRELEGLKAIFGRGEVTLRPIFGGRLLGDDLTCLDYAPYIVAVVKIACDCFF